MDLWTIPYTHHSIISLIKKKKKKENYVGWFIGSGNLRLWYDSSPQNNMILNFWHNSLIFPICLCQ